MLIISITLSFLFVIISLIVRYSFAQKPIEKIRASWISFGFATVATAICTLMAGEPQGTLISGFLTMILCYNILIR